MTSFDINPDIALAERLFAALHDASFDGVGVTRDAYGPGERLAHAMMRAEAELLRLEIAVDPAGNLLLTLPGSDRALPRVVIGSHLDSVAQGGDYDGPAGVFAALAVLAGARHAAWQPARDVTLLVIRAEESGAWFPTSFPGSRAALGTLPPEALSVPRQDTGRTLAWHMAEEGFDPDAVRAGHCLLPPASVASYVEVHIEQGPLLDGQQISVGIVTGIPGSRRLRDGRVLGETNHSGATPRRARRDAAIALAELAVALDEYWLELELAGHTLVMTFCVLATTGAAAMGKVPAEARFSLDVRSVDPASVDAVFSQLHRLVPRIEARRGVTFQLGPETGSRPTPLHTAVVAGLTELATAAGIEHRLMPSGGGHDPVAFAEAGVPAGLIFVRNQHGSHSPAEAMRLADFAEAARLLALWVQREAGGPKPLAGSMMGGV